ncbi:MAG: class I SAM-dependent methyltransferase [Opitutales bacterium]
METIHQALAKILRPGDLAIDATAGNGHDVAFLAQLVGESGQVSAFDVQSAALAATEKRLEALGALARCSLHHLPHERMAEVLPPEIRGRVKAIVFNLGYLPGGNKSIVTTTENTLVALETSLDCLAPGGLLAVTAYRGHPGGMQEALAVEDRLASLPTTDFEVSMEKCSSEPTSPIAFLVRKRQKSEALSPS